MARADKVEVVLSATDRQLLRDIRDALRALGVEPEDEAEATNSVRRLIESDPGAINWYWDYKFFGDHIVADSMGYQWDGNGWVEKE